MSGPIVRTGTTPKFWENWEQAFGGGQKKDGAKGATKVKAPKASQKKTDKKKAGKKKKVKK